jgi:two-component system NtrC family sensor kinase
VSSYTLPATKEVIPRASWPLRAILVGSVVGPLLLLALASWQDYRQLNREAEHSVAKTVDILHEHAVKVLETVELALGRIDEHVAGMGWDEISTSEPLHLYLRSSTRACRRPRHLADRPRGARPQRRRLLPAPPTSVVGDRDISSP